jgi:four helix bundle protein
MVNREVQQSLVSFEQSDAWQQSQDLAVAVYEATKNFPQEDKFGITNQIRRAASSISANIAEGFGRRARKDKKHFYIMAYGSLLETKNFIYLSTKLKYLSDDRSETLLQQCIRCQKLINGLVRSLADE